MLCLYKVHQLLTRSVQNVGKDKSIEQNNHFTVLDQNVVVQSNGLPKGYIRRVVSQEIALRNALGERE